MKLNAKLTYIIIALVTLMLISSISILSAFSLDVTKDAKNSNDSIAITPGAVIEDTSRAQSYSGTFPAPIHVPRDSVYKKSVYEKTNITSKKTFLNNSASVALTYSKSEISEGGNHADVYVSNNGDEYRFNKNGEILSITASDKTFLSGVGTYVGDKAIISDLTKDTATKLAVQAAKAQFGSKFDLLEFDHIRQDKTSRCFYVYFKQKLGENGFVNGIQARITVFPNGTVADCCMDNYDDLINFEHSLLGSFTKEKVLSDINKQFDLLYGDVLSDYTIQSIDLKNDNGSYYVEVITKSTLKTGVSICDIFRYDLTQTSQTK